MEDSRGDPESRLNVPRVDATVGTGCLVFVFAVHSVLLIRNASMLPVLKARRESENVGVVVCVGRNTALCGRIRKGRLDCNLH